MGAPSDGNRDKAWQKGMTTRIYNTSKLEQAQQALQSIAIYRRQKPSAPWDGLYYELLSKYFHNLLHAREQGQFVVTQSDIMPSEIIYAMDMVPFRLSMVCSTLGVLAREQETLLSTAKSHGLPAEICSVHRLSAGVFFQGWAPPVDAVIWSNECCDSNAKSSELICHLYGAPGFYLDCPYYFNEAGFNYLAGELKDLFAFLGQVTGRPLKLERLREVLLLSQRTLKLNREINELRKAIPYPANSRLGIQMSLIRSYWGGCPEAVQFLELVRDSLQANIPQARPQEAFRFLSLFAIPNHSWKLMDWMEREHQAYLIYEPPGHHFGPIRWDLSRHFHTLAQCCLAEPAAYLTYSPVEKWVEAVREDALAYHADGVVFWAHIGCHQAGATIRTVKDALQSQGIPCLALDVDTGDPSFVSEEELKGRLEGFFERLRDSR